MVAIGRALMTRPELVAVRRDILGLAPTVIKDIYARIKKINAGGTTVLLVEQDVKSSASKPARSPTSMLKGRVVLSDFRRSLARTGSKAHISAWKGAKMIQQIINGILFGRVLPRSSAWA
jgi:ABC-type branched-subunit amino acid transport system ATPase component